MKQASFYNGKKVLFVAPKFYNYHTTIINSLEDLGSSVIYYPEINHTLVYRLSHKISKLIEKKIEHNYIKNIINSINNNEFDIVLVIRGCAFTSLMMNEMRSKLPNAIFILYQWDSVKQNNYLDLINSFDIVKTFDRLDAINYRLDYQPLFYSRDYEGIEAKNNYKINALCFFGAYHSDRLVIIKYFDNFFRKSKHVFKHHLYIKKIALLRRLLTREIRFSDLKYFKTYSVCSKDIIDTYAKSTAVLDVELDIQSGLSIRTFEVLGSGLKLITTNEYIEDEVFYCEEAIEVIDRKDIKISMDFFDKRMNMRLVGIENYRIDKWLLNLVK